ncbi:flagellar hook protein FlgE [Sphingomonas oligophenolica]|uniref:Flagellar hook-basal body complex protein n=1 Tax=Sphingomonas oligophenolica TaxID=301154 RepID=A0ABU9Y403_9SPHN
MFGAIYIGLSGLNAYSRGLQMVSNNVTNLNSQGFKSSTVNFRDLFGAQGNGGLSFSSGEGSAGHGVEVGGSNYDMAQGELRQTNRDLDLAVDGSGFLMLMRGEEVAYTRTGSFEVDKDGFITLSGTDYRLATLDSSGHPVSLSIDNSRTSSPQATTAIKFANNLSADASAPILLSDIKVYDKNGGAHTWKITLTRDTSTPGQWTVSGIDDKGNTLTPASQTLKIVNGLADPANSTLSLTEGDVALSVNLDFSGIKSFTAGTASTLSASAVDGYALGSLTSVTVNDKGELELGYSNEQKVQLGAVAVADFRDPSALKQRSGGLFTDSGSAGRQLLTTEDPRAGNVVSKRLEASNVDLSAEFGDLILIQRGFQASSQIISVSNDMIQQLFGIRGQG